ncbi:MULTISPECIES: hypothetical protein [Lysinibacillus]|uniref:hypothetical protein n=1 Tax=Lysinibacillus TaxID=400634 RepID=UPI001C2FA312|nr:MULTISPECIES: hypothetical protein [Lysinibacillus]
MKGLLYIVLALLVFLVGFNLIKDNALSRVTPSKIEAAISEATPQMINVIENHNSSESYGKELMIAGKPVYNLTVDTTSYIINSVLFLLSIVSFIIYRNRETLEDCIFEFFNNIFS